MKLARGTPAWVPLVPGGAVAAVVLGAALDPVWFAAALPLVVLSALLLNFFRDPERAPAAGIVAPADGVVTEVTEHEGRPRVNTFMNPLNVHVNRAPFEGRVASVAHVPGGFVPAFRKESERNERVVIDFETPIGPIRTVQIAGTVARRIVPYVAPGASLRKGDRIGMIRLGSRVDLYLPAGSRVAVRPGEKVRAGTTTIAHPPEARR